MIICSSYSQCIGFCLEFRIGQGYAHSNNFSACKNWVSNTYRRIQKVQRINELQLCITLSLTQENFVCSKTGIHTQFVISYNIKLKNKIKEQRGIVKDNHQDFLMNFRFLIIKYLIV